MRERILKVKMICHLFEVAEDFLSLAEMIEDAIFQKFKSTNPKYKNKIRSRVFNLRDKKNPELRENVLCGTISEEK